MARLSFEPDQRAYWRESLVSMQTQGCFPCSLAYELADDAWYGVGDLSYDGHYYSKRLLLAGAVAMTLWIWLNDETQDLQVTSDYLERQLHRVVHLGRSLSSWPRMGQALEKSIKKIPFVRLAWRSLRRSFSP
jgi:rpsU-divergently transcribed protein